MNRTVTSRKQQSQEKPEVFRTPEKLSDLVYEQFNTLAHKSRLVEGTPTWANRMCRMEAFTREELLELRDLMTDREKPETEISRRILGGTDTLSWIDSVLNPGSKAKAAISANNG